MKKKILSMILAVAMVLSMLAGITITASAAEGIYVLADSIAVGDTVILATTNGTKVFTGVSSNIGQQADATPTGNNLESAEAAALTVVAGAAEGTFAFRQADGNYLAVTADKNNLYLVDEVADTSSWTVEITDGVAVVTNVRYTARILQYNSSSPRFCAYKGTQQSVSFYKQATGLCTHADATSEVTAPATCTEDGTLTYTCSCGKSWTEVIKALGHSYDEGTVITASTCTAEGLIRYSCTVCGYEKEDALPMNSHYFENNVCICCGYGAEPPVYYKAIDLDAPVEGNYLIGAVRSEAYPNVYIATAEIASGDIVTTDNYVTVADGFICDADLDENARAFTFTGNNTDGFTISYVDVDLTMYLGVSSYSSNRKLAWSVDYGTVLWKVASTGKDDGYYLYTAIPNSEKNYTVSQNSTGTAPIRGYSSGTIYTGIYLFAEAEYCAHENTTEIAAVEATCTTAGNTAGIVCTDCGATVEGNETIPALGHNLETSVTEDQIITVCTQCGDTQSKDMDTLAEAKAFTDKETVYYVKGVVTYINGRNVYIQDETDGICVYFSSSADTSTLALGDKIFVSATMTDYKGLLELNGPTEYTLLSVGNELPPEAATLADLAADTTGYYLCKRVVIEGLTIGAINTSGSTTLTDAEGNTIALYKAAGLDEIAKEGDVVTVTASVSKYNNYQLVLNPATMAQDVVPYTAPVKEIRLCHTLNLESDIAVNYAVAADSLAGYENFYISVIVPEYEGNELVRTKTMNLQPELRGDYYYFVCNGLVAFEMRNVLEATLYAEKNGETVILAGDTYSIATYAAYQLDNEAAPAELKTICANLLQYGANAQLWKEYRTDALATDVMTEEQRSYLTAPETVTFGSNRKHLNDLENAQVSFIGIPLCVDSKIAVRFVVDTTKYEGAPEDLSLRVSYVDVEGVEQTATVTGPEVFSEPHNFYAFTFDGLLAAELRTVMSVAVYAGETRVSETMEYSVDTYGNGKTGTLLTLIQSMIAYSDSVKAYFA